MPPQVSNSPVKPAPEQASPATATPTVVAPAPSQSPSVGHSSVNMTSFNTTAMRHSRRSAYTSNIVIILLIVAFVGAIMALWYLAGSPTTVDDIPVLE